MAAPYQLDEYPHYTHRHYHYHNHHSQSPYIQQEHEPRGLNSLEDLNEPLLLVQQMAHQRPPPHMGGAGGSGHLYGPGLSSSSKPRARTHDEIDIDLSGMRGDEDDQDVDSHYQHHLPPPSHHHQHPQHTHHHHMPDQPPPAKMARTSSVMGVGGGSQMGGSSIAMPGPSSLAGPSSSQQMPAPAPRPRGPKLKFTPEDDQLLVDLKENKALTWKQIAEFFPGRSSGTLQVRYCTKLKAKTTQWTDETVRKPSPVLFLNLGGLHTPQVSPIIGLLFGSKDALVFLTSRPCCCQ